MPQPVDQHFAQIAHRAADRCAVGPRPFGPDIGKPRHQRGDQLGLFGELRRACVGHREQLLGTLGLARLDQPHIVEQGERRIDHPRARRIGTPGQLFDLTDQIIAVARFVGDQLEQDEPQLAAVEHPPPARAASPAITAFSATASVIATTTEAAMPETATHHAHPARMTATAAAFYKYKHIVPFL